MQTVRLTLAILTVILSAAARPAAAQWLPPHSVSSPSATVSRSQRAVAADLARSIADTVAIGKTRWLEGGVIGGSVLGVLSAAVFGGWCASEHEGGCVGRAIGAGLVGGTLGFSIGALIGGQITVRAAMRLRPPPN